MLTAFKERNYFYELLMNLSDQSLLAMIANNRYQMISRYRKFSS